MSRISRPRLGSSKLPSSSPTSLFDVRVVYVRVSGCPLDDESSPESLQFFCPPRPISTSLEVNGARISPSEDVILNLRRDRVDCDSAEVTYVSTDNVRCSSSLHFQVLNMEQQLLSGSLSKIETSGCLNNDETELFPDSENSADGNSYDSLSSGTMNLVDNHENPNFVTQAQCLRLGWNLDVNCTVGVEGCVFLKNKSSELCSTIVHPSLEVCIVGRFNGSPVILTQTLPLMARRRMKRTLNSIPEIDENNITNSLSNSNGESGRELATTPNRQRENDPLIGFQEKADAMLGGFYGEGGIYGEGEDGEMSWFNAGVRVGVGLGLGMCLGLGIGVGLMIRTYQATTRSFRRGLF